MPTSVPRYVILIYVLNLVKIFKSLYIKYGVIENWLLKSGVFLIGLTSYYSLLKRAMFFFKTKLTALHYLWIPINIRISSRRRQFSLDFFNFLIWLLWWRASFISVEHSQVNENQTQFLSFPKVIITKYGRIPAQFQLRTHRVLKIVETATIYWYFIKITLRINNFLDYIIY